MGTPSDEEVQAENVKILERGLECYLDEYREQSAIWQAFETKAQATITASGIFLAAAFAFSREPIPSVAARITLLLTLAALLFAFASAISVLRATEFDLPFDGAAAVAAATKFLSQSSAAVDARYCSYLHELAADAPEVLGKITAVNEDKAGRLANAQGWLFPAAFLSVATTLLHLAWPLTRL